MLKFKLLALTYMLIGVLATSAQVTTDPVIVQEDSQNVVV